MAPSSAPLRLAVFDLDGTLLRGATVCEMLAIGLGHGQRMRELEQLTELEDIRKAREEIVVWYKDHSRHHLESLLSTSYLAPGAEAALEFLARRGVKIAIASLTWLFAVNWFGARLGADFTLGSEFHPDGGIDHCWPIDKARWVARLSKELGCSRDSVAVVGDSTFDVPMLWEAGSPVFVGTRVLPGLPDRTELMPAADIRAVVARIIPERKPEFGLS